MRLGTVVWKDFIQTLLDLFFLVPQTFASVDFIEGMVLILDGNLKIGAHVRSNLCYLICLRHLTRSGGVTSHKSPKRPILLDCKHCMSKQLLKVS